MVSSGHKQWGQRAFPGCSSRWESQPSLQHWAPGSAPSLPPSLPPAAAHSQAGRASPWLPCSRAAQSNSPGHLLRFLPRILFRVLCNRREMENLSDQTGLWNHPETCWIFIIAGCLELAWEWKKTQFLKNHYILWVRRILNLLCRKHWVPYGAIKGLTYRVIHTLTPCYILEISF